MAKICGGRYKEATLGKDKYSDGWEIQRGKNNARKQNGKMVLEKMGKEVQVRAKLCVEKVLNRTVVER